MEKILIFVIALTVLLLLRVIHLLLAKMGYEASVEVLFSNVKKSKKDLLMFLEKNKDTFYSPKNWEAIVEVKNKIKDLDEHKEKYKKDTDYVESIADLSPALYAEYEKKLFGFILAKHRNNENLLKLLNSLAFAVVVLSKEVASKPLDRGLRAQCKKDYLKAVEWVKTTASFLRKLNLRNEAEHLEFWGAV